MIRKGGREETLLLDDTTRILNEDAKVEGLPKWTTTVQFPNRTVIFTSHQDGYFEARKLLSPEAVR